MEFINHYSMVMSFIFVLAVVAFFLLRDGATTKDFYILAMVAGLLVFAWTVLRPATDTTETVSQLQVEIGQGQPILLELQSPF